MNLLEKVYIIGNFFVLSVCSISLLDTKPSPCSFNFLTWAVALVLDTVRFVAYGMVVKETDSADFWTMAELAINFSRLLTLVLLVSLYVVFKASRRSPSVRFHLEEASPLLPANGTNGHAANGQQNYGSTRSSAAATRSNSANRNSARGTRSPANSYRDGEDTEDEQDEPGWTRPEKMPSRGWWEYLKGYGVFFPYLWPSGNKRLQITVLTCFFLVMIQRAVNIFVPYMIGVITDDLSVGVGQINLLKTFGSIGIFVFIKLLQGNNGLIGTLRSYLWIPVSQYAYRELSVAGFEHVHSLSLDFHIGKKTGEVLSALGKGNSINSFLDKATFQVLPMVIDLVVAIGYFLIAFDAYYALVITIMTFWYVYFTIRLAKWRANARRAKANLDRHSDGVK
jgi:hypothetical protein